MQSYHPISAGRLSDKRRRRYADNVMYSKELRSHWRYWGGAEVALGQGHHPLAVEWFNGHQGFTNDRFKWGIKYRPMETVPPIDPATWTTDVEGLYYVDPTHPAAVDNTPIDAPPENYNRPRGNPSHPRREFPRNVEPGAIIYTGGGPFSNQDWTTHPYAAFVVGGQGSETAPIYVRGDAFGPRTVLNYPLQLEGKYIVVQGFSIVPTEQIHPGLGLYGDSGNAFPANHHLLVRDCDITKPLPIGHSPSSTAGIAINGTAEKPVSDVIVYRCKVKEFGNPEAGGDGDMHGIKVSPYSSHVTIMNCDLSRCEGNGIQIGHESVAKEHTQRIFVYNNESYANRQSCYGLKRAEYVSFVQNKAHDSNGSASDLSGAGVFLQDGPHHVKIVANDISVCRTGVSLESSGVGPAYDVTVADNTIFDVDDVGGTLPGPPPGDISARGWAIKNRGSGAFPVINNNKMISCTAGIGQQSGYLPATITSNQFECIEFDHIYFQDPFAACDSFICGNQAVLPCLEPLRIVPVCPPDCP